MSLEIGLRPQSIVVNTSNAFTATTSNSSGSALLTYSTHGLSTDDIIFINSDYSYYNGFWYVRVIDPNTFFIVTNTLTTQAPLEYPGVNQSVTFYKQSSSHRFSCVHLPVVYKLKSNLFPTNIVDTARTVNTFSNDQGYTKLTLSGDLKTGVNALEFVKLTVNSVESVYQILQVFSDSQVTIDLEYDGGNVFGNCQYYYSNYHAKIKVYAGITGTGSVTNPVELITEIEAVPDSDSIVTININEYLKNKISILSNDPDKYTIPRDIDAFCEFYIQYAESYDDSSDGYTLGTYTSSYTSDSATPCYAVNAKLPFKNRYSGWMSEYLGSSRKFLTTMTAPSLFVNNYFDIPFLLDDSLDSYVIYLRLQRYIGATLSYSDYLTITYYGQGVYRMPITYAGVEDSIVASLVIQNNPASPTYQVISGSAGGTDTETINYFTPAGSTPTETYSLFASIGAPAGAGDQAIASVRYDFIDGTNQTIQSLAINSIVNTLSSGTVVFPSPAKDVQSITITATTVQTGGGNTLAATVDLAGFSSSYNLVSELKTIEVDQECTNQDIYLTWKNYLGGHDYWLFTAEKEYGVDIIETTESTTNIFPEWPKSYGEFSDTIDFETSRRSKDTILVRSQNLTLDQVTGLKYIKTSPLVQIMESSSNRRTVIVDPNSFVVYNETDKIYGIQFTIRYTDDIASQSL